MAIKKEVLMYGVLYSWAAEYMVNQINQFDDEDDITMRIATQGGIVMQGLALLSKLADRKGSVQMFVDGEAYSMGAFVLLYGINNIGSEASEYMFHKAAYPDYYQPNEQEQQLVKQTNERFKALMTKKLNKTPEAKALIAKVFEPDVRNNVFLTAEEALKVGLISEIKPIDLSVKALVDEYAQIAALKDDAIKGNNIKFAELQGESEKPELSNINQKQKKMTIDQLKAEHPDVFKQVVALGVAQERDRVGSFLVFLDGSPAAVKKGIEDGHSMTETQRSEFAIASFRALANNAEATENPKPVNPATPTKEEAEAKKQADIKAALEKQGLTLKA